MEGRIQILEENYSSLSRNVSTLTTDVATIGTAVKEMSAVLGKLQTFVEANKPISYLTILSTVIGTATVVGMIASAIFFLIDARVGSATLNSNRFVSQMTDEGRIYVAMERLNLRIERLEAAIKWQPVFVTTVEPQQKR